MEPALSISSTWLAIATVLVLLCLGSSSHALEIEKLVMPGDVIQGHAKFEADCDACHKSFSREHQNALCGDCHEPVAADQKAGRGFHGKDPEARSGQCSDCHTEHRGRAASIVSFETAGFDHSKSDFALLGKHRDVECEDCHVPGAGKWRDAKQQCQACHSEDDTHAGTLGENCAACHVPAGWDEWEFDHFANNGYALTGEHANVGCADCHADNHYSDTVTECAGCHRQDDVHKGRNGNDCVSCHTTRSWDESIFDHATQTAFPLLGGHASVECEQCHRPAASTMAIATTCISCHRSDDVHKGLLGDACDDCHTSNNWQASRFNHDIDTKFPLLGKHGPLECSACHADNPAQVTLGTACVDCHRDDDPHSGQLGEDCGSCHGESDWNAAVVFDHDLSPFPLIGSHRDVACADCHTDSRFRDAPSSCAGCHTDDDIHGGRLGSDCGTCHNPVNWGNWRFDHFETTGFILDGAHDSLRCTDCHRKPIDAASRTPSRCVDCHRRDDIHNGQFGKDCERCHYNDSFDRIRSLP